MAVTIGMIAAPNPPLFGPSSVGLPPIDDPELERHADLVQWRDRVLERHHPTAPASR